MLVTWYRVCINTYFIFSKSVFRHVTGGALSFTPGTRRVNIPLLYPI